MTTKPIYSQEWNSLKEANHEFMVSKHNFRKTNDFFKQILSALNFEKGITQQKIALKLIRKI